MFLLIYSVFLMQPNIYLMDAWECPLGTVTSELRLLQHSPEFPGANKSRRGF